MLDKVTSTKSSVVTSSMSANDISSCSLVTADDFAPEKKKLKCTAHGLAPYVNTYLVESQMVNTAGKMNSDNWLSNQPWNCHEDMQ